MLKLLYFPGNASLVVHLVLEEIGAPFELEYVDRGAQAHKSPAYLAMNPNGLIPVLIDSSRGQGDGPLVLYETLAIVMHLADTHPAAGLLPPLGSDARAEAMKHLAWLATTLQATLIVYFYPERWADDATAIAQVKAHAEARVGAMLDQLDEALATHGGPWLLGAAHGLADAYAFVLCRWTRGFERPARDRSHVRAWLDRVAARPATGRVFAREGLQAPWF